MSEYIHKSHNVSVMLYHFVCPAKYRKKIFIDEVDKALKEICIDISERYEMNFLEIGSDDDHVHFLIQSVPTYPATKIITILKSITAKEIFKRCPEVKKQLWGGNLWTSGYFVSTVGKHGNEQQIENYVKNQGKAYNKMYRGELAEM